DLNAWPLSVCSGPLGAKVVKPAVGICHPAPVDLAASASVLVDFFCFPSRKIVSTSDGLRSGDIRVYPVPTSGLLQVVVSDYTIGAPLSWRVCDPLGRIMQAGALTHPFVDLSALPAGLYLLHVEGPHHHWVKPVMKQ
ncbi:MAG: T9SS type A sorting domain-containing protein, partial [Saprospiraceae bacterium]|nr:T9SS type A sorting domain-containing protein [Saprospiraceae bacterium]